MNFDQNGRHIKGVHRTTINQNNVVVNLESRYDGISDTTLNTVLDMVHEERMEDFHSILGQLYSLSQEY